MPETVKEDIRQVVRAALGRDLTEAEVQQLARPLALALAAISDRLLWWQARLGEIQPATVYALEPGETPNDG